MLNPILNPVRTSRELSLDWDRWETERSSDDPRSPESSGLLASAQRLNIQSLQHWLDLSA